MDDLDPHLALCIEPAHVTFHCIRESNIRFGDCVASCGAGVDVVIESAGAYSALQTALRCARVDGTVCSVGFYQGEANNLWLGREWHHNRLTMIVSHGCGWGHLPRDYLRRDQKRVYVRLIAPESDKVIKYAVQF